MEEMTREVRTWVRWALLSVMVCHLSVLCLTQWIGNDESFYVSSAWLTAHGHFPYRDFAYLQMPALPFIYGAFFRTFPFVDPVLIGRLLSLAFFFGSVWLVYAIVRRSSGDTIALSGCAFLASLSSCYPALRAENYAGAVFCLLLSYWLWARQRPLLAGLLLSAAASWRLTVAALAIPYMWAAWKERTITQLALGVFIGAIPALTMLLFWPRQFWFDNVVFHFVDVVRLDASAWIVHRLDVLVTMLRDPALLLSALGITVSALSVRPRATLPLALVVVGAIVAMWHTPVYSTYFVPVMFVGMLCLGSCNWSRGRSRFVVTLAVLALAASMWLNRYAYSYAWHGDTAITAAAFHAPGPAFCWRPQHCLAAGLSVAPEWSIYPFNVQYLEDHRDPRYWGTAEIEEKIAGRIFGSFLADDQTPPVITDDLARSGYAINATFKSPRFERGRRTLTLWIRRADRGELTPVQ